MDGLSRLDNYGSRDDRMLCVHRRVGYRRAGPCRLTGITLTPKVTERAFQLLAPGFAKDTTIGWHAALAKKFVLFHIAGWRVAVSTDLTRGEAFRLLHQARAAIYAGRVPFGYTVTGDTLVPAALDAGERAAVARHA